MADLEKLAADHARWADEIRGLVEESRQLDCVNTDHWTNDSCIGGVFKEFQNDNAGCGPFDHITFEEVWDEYVADGDVCENCQRVRELKRQRMNASRRLGAVRAAITKAGRRLAAKEQ